MIVRQSVVCDCEYWCILVMKAQCYFFYRILATVNYDTDEQGTYKHNFTSL